MADTADNNPGNDLEAQLDALMKQAREGNTADEAEAAEEPAAAAVATEPEPATDDAADEAPADLASQIDALMAKVGQEEDTTEPEPEATAEAVPGTDVIADGPAEVEDAFDDLQGAFDAVQDVIAELESEEANDATPEPEPDTAAVVAEADPPAPEAAAEPAADETEAEREQRDDDLAAQLQSLLDEASAQESDSFVSPDELLDESAPPEATSPEAEAAAEPESEAEETSTEDQPLIEQIDSLLANHAEDAISGEFESVDELLGVDSTAGENVADPADDLDEDEEDDGLDGGFQSMEDLLAKPDEEAEETAEPAAEGPEDAAVELDQLDGLFAAPAPHTPSPPAASAVEDDAEDASGFESLDELLTAPEPTEDERDSATPAADTTNAAEAEAASASQSNPGGDSGDTSGGGWKFTIDVRTLQAAAALLLGWTLWACALVNKPLAKFPEEIQQTVGWVALAVAGPGLLLVVYGLLLN